MDKDCFLRVAAGVPRIRPADTDYNTGEILKIAHNLSDEGVEVAVLPELCVTGYTCGDLFSQSLLIEEADQAIGNIADATADLPMLLCIGAPVEFGNCLYNCGLAIYGGKILACVPKTFIPDYNEFYEKRHFASGNDISGNAVIAGQNVPFGTSQIISHADAKIGIELCEDLWAPLPPSTYSALSGADIILNLSASNEVTGKHEYLRQLIIQQSARLMCGYVYASAGEGESSTDLVFSGNAIIAENGHLLKESPRFKDAPLVSIADIDTGLLRKFRRQTSTWGDSVACARPSFDIRESGATALRADSALMRHLNPLPFVPPVEERHSRCREIISIQVAGLMQRMKSIGCGSITVGISGGLDSTLALLVAAETFDRMGLLRTGINAVTMPGFGTTDRTYENALTLMRQLGVTSKEISIAEAVRGHFKDIGHDEAQKDVTYENSQARERTQILMDYANKTGGIVLGTGDLSELALGWCTYNGDHMSMYAVNASIPKTLIKYMVETFAIESDDPRLAETLTDIINTPISPELLPASPEGEIAQKTEDLVGPYALHDFFLYHTVRHGFRPSKIFRLAKSAFGDAVSPEDIKKNLIKFYRRFFSQQFKRSCMPDGPKVGSVCLSPRGDWRMPSDASCAIWINEAEELPYC